MILSKGDTFVKSMEIVEITADNEIILTIKFDASMLGYVADLMQEILNQKARLDHDHVHSWLYSLRKSNG